MAAIAAGVGGRTRPRRACSATAPRRRCCTTSASSAISNRILDKPGPITPSGRRCAAAEVSLQILGGVEAFRDLAWLAAVHHERLDGTGYFRKG